MAEDIDDGVQKLKSACEEGFLLYPGSCSHAVTHAIKKFKPSQHFMTANQLVHDLARAPDWEEVSVHELASLANKGTLVVGGLVGSGHGHVIVFTLDTRHRPAATDSGYQGVFLRAGYARQ